MKNYGHRLRQQVATSTRSFPFNLKQLGALVVVSLFGVTAALGVEDPDQTYLGILKIMQKADTLSEAGKAEAALAKYQEAQTNLVTLKKNFPSWNVKLVTYRLDYLSDKIETLSKPPPAPVESPAPAEKAEAAPTPAPAAKPSSVQVQLLDAGAEPRQQLRLHPKPGDKQSVAITIKSTLDMGTGQPIKMPAIKMHFENVIQSVSSEGLIAYETTFGDASLAEDGETASPMAEALKISLAGMKGLVIAGTVSTRGLSSAVKIRSSPGNPQTRMMLEQIKEAMSTFSCPLPEDAVGAGAKWEVRQPIKMQGLTIAQTATYELATIKGDRLETKTSIAQSLSNAGNKAELGKMAGSGTGTSTWELTRVYPARASIDGHSELAVGAGANKQGMTMKTETSIQIESN